MKTLLKIRTSIYGPDGASSTLADNFARNWLANHPGGRILTRDLNPGSIPHLTAERFEAFAMAAEQSSEQLAAVELSDALISELEAADDIVLAAPMYNFSVSSTLRAYFDHIARAGVTFRYTADGPQGLLSGKKTYVIVTRGGKYSANEETQTAYLKQFLGFIGLNAIEWVVADGLALDEQTRSGSLRAARQTIDRLQLPEAAAA